MYKTEYFRLMLKILKILNSQNNIAIDLANQCKMILLKDYLYMNKIIKNGKQYQK